MNNLWEMDCFDGGLYNGSVVNACFFGVQIFPGPDVQVEQVQVHASHDRVGFMVEKGTELIPSPRVGVFVVEKGTELIPSPR